MEFDKSRCYTSLNADELSAGDKVLTSNNIASLKEAVRLDVEPSVIVTIWEEMYDKRFQCKSTDTIYDAELAYLVERAENCFNCKKYPCNDEIEEEGKEVDLKIYSCCGYESKTEQEVEKHYRPFKDTEELIGFYRHNKEGVPAYDLPLIWVKKKVGDIHGVGKFLITGFFIDEVEIRNVIIDMKIMFDMYEFLDGSPCGVEE